MQDPAEMVPANGPAPTPISIRIDSVPAGAGLSKAMVVLEVISCTGSHVSFYTTAEAKQIASGLVKAAVEADAAGGGLVIPTLNPDAVRRVIEDGKNGKGPR